jgi:hypothetical protein
MGSGGGGGGGTSTSVSNPQLYSWREILPPWVQSGQQSVLPWLMSRAQEGLLPDEEAKLWGQIKEQIESSSNEASRNLARQIATSGMSPSSPMVSGGFADLASDRLTTTSKAALDYAKMKLGQKDTAIGQLLTALYTPPPVAVGQTTTQYQQSRGGGK